MSSIIRITIPGKPPNTNNYQRFSTRGGYARRYTIPSAKTFLSMVTDLASNQKLSINERKQFISIEIYFYLNNLFKKDGSINKTVGDWDGLSKPLVDAVFKGIGLNDGLICNALVKRLQGDEDRTVIIIRAEYLEALHGQVL